MKYKFLLPYLAYILLLFIVIYTFGSLLIDQPVPMVYDIALFAGLLILVALDWYMNRGKERTQRKALYLVMRVVLVAVIVVRIVF